MEPEIQVLNPNPRLSTSNKKKISFHVSHHLPNQIVLQITLVIMTQTKNRNQFLKTHNKLLKKNHLYLESEIKIRVLQYFLE
jgi:hypothetical protein